MTVDFSSLGAGSPLQTTFSDTFTRANKSTWGPNWMRTLAQVPGGGANAESAAASVSGNQAVLTSVTGGGATQNYIPIWIPLPVYSNQYNLAGLFVQFTFQAVQAGFGCGIVLRYNHDLNNGQTQVEGSDYYDMLTNGQIGKTVGGGARNTIGAGTWVVAAGDVVRFECLTIGATVTTQAIRNGAILQTINDNAATAILNGGSGVIALTSNANALTFNMTNFSCGPLAALSV